MIKNKTLFIGFDKRFDELFKMKLHICLLTCQKSIFNPRLIVTKVVAVET